MGQSEAIRDFTLLRGGPFARLEQRLHLQGGGSQTLRRRALAAVAIGWLPLLILACIDQLRSPGALLAFAKDATDHVRLLFVLPLLLMAEPGVDCRLRRAVEYIAGDSELVATASRPKLEAAAAWLARARNAWWLEGGLVLASFLASFARIHSPHTISVLSASDSPLPLAHLWFVAVSVPLSVFLLLRWWARGVLWSIFLWKLSRLELRVTRTHPDLCGGLGFLAMAQTGFWPVLLAMGALIAAHRFHLRLEGAPTNLSELLLPQIVFAVAGTTLLFLPLTFFSGTLVRARRELDLPYSALAARHARAFEEKWFDPASGKQVLGASDVSSAVNLGTWYQTCEKMRLVPIERPSVLIALAAALLPVLAPLMLERQLLDLVREVAQRVF